MKHDIFFSYSHRDSHVAKDLVSKLEASGLDCFIAEKDIRAGQLWEERVRHSIESSERMLLLITPRSKNSLWVAAEAGAAWVLQKDLIACLMFVEPDELIEPISRHQARQVETTEEIEALIRELAPVESTVTKDLTGQWIDHRDKDTVYFKQIGDRVVGFYDYGSATKKVGVYTGIVQDGVLQYKWRWISRDLDGNGEMRLSDDGKRLSGEWWYEDDRPDIEKVEYQRVSEKMPSWVSDADFEDYRAYFKTGET